MGIFNWLFGKKLNKRRDTRHQAIYLDDLDEISRFEKLGLTEAQIDIRESFYTNIKNKVKVIAEKQAVERLNNEDRPLFQNLYKVTSEPFAKPTQSCAFLFAEKTGIGNLPTHYFTTGCFGTDIYPDVKNCLFHLIDNYPPELAAHIVSRHTPPPIGDTLILTMFMISAVDPNRINKVVEILACWLCWIKSFSVSQGRLMMIKDKELRFLICDSLNRLARSLGWSEAEEMYFVT